MYAYNILWNGRHGIWETFWSANMSEYAPHKFINYISLGNKFHFTNNLQLEFDYWNRAASGQGFIGKDCSIIGQLSYQPTEKVTFLQSKLRSESCRNRCWCSVTRWNRTHSHWCRCRILSAKEKNIRIHGYYSYAFGKNTNPEGVVQDKMSQVNVGVTWRGKVL